MKQLFREPIRNTYEKSEMTVEEQIRKDRLQQLKEDLEKAQNRLSQEQEACRANHAWKDRIFYDTPGMEYTLRFCAVCGSCLETI